MVGGVSRNLTYLCSELDAKFDATVTPDADSFGAYIAEIDKQTTTNGTTTALPISQRSGPNLLLVVVLTVVLTMLAVGVVVLLRANWALILTDMGSPPNPPSSSHATDL